MHLVRTEFGRTDVAAGRSLCRHIAHRHRPSGRCGARTLPCILAPRCAPPAGSARHRPHRVESGGHRTACRVRVESARCTPPGGKCVHRGQLNAPCARRSAPARRGPGHPVRGARYTCGRRRFSLADSSPSTACSWWWACQCSARARSVNRVKPRAVSAVGATASKSPTAWTNSPVVVDRQTADKGCFLTVAPARAHIPVRAGRLPGRPSAGGTEDTVPADPTPRPTRDLRTVPGPAPAGPVGKARVARGQAVPHGRSRGQQLGSTACGRPEGAGARRIPAAATAVAQNRAGSRKVWLRAMRWVIQPMTAGPASMPT